MIPLHPEDLRLLAGLDEDCGYSTRDAAENAGLPIGRSATAKWREAFKHMQKIGLVADFDARKPVAWVRTPAGTAALSDSRTGAEQAEEER